MAASSYCATGIDLFGNPASPVFSPAPGPIRTARNGLSAVGRYGHGRTSRLPLGPPPLPIGRPRPWSARSAIRRFETSPLRKNRAFAHGFANRVKSTQRRPSKSAHKRAGSARKRSSAKGVHCATGVVLATSCEYAGSTHLGQCEAALALLENVAAERSLQPTIFPSRKAAAR